MIFTFCVSNSSLQSLSGEGGKKNRGSKTAIPWFGESWWWHWIGKPILKSHNLSKSRKEIDIERNDSHIRKTHLRYGDPRVFLFCHLQLLSCVNPFPWFTLRFKHARSFPEFTDSFTACKQSQLTIFKQRIFLGFSLAQWIFKILKQDIFVMSPGGGIR